MSTVFDIISFFDSSPFFKIGAILAFFYSTSSLPDFNEKNSIMRKGKVEAVLHRLVKSGGCYNDIILWHYARPPLPIEIRSICDSCNTAASIALKDIVCICSV